MEEFTAKQARQLAQQHSENDLECILNTIKEQAEKGITTIYLYESLEASTVLSLKSKGFDVSEKAAGGNPRTGIHHVISWE